MYLSASERSDTHELAAMGRRANSIHFTEFELLLDELGVTPKKISMKVYLNEYTRFSSSPHCALAAYEPCHGSGGLGWSLSASLCILSRAYCTGVLPYLSLISGSLLLASNDPTASSCSIQQPIVMASGLQNPRHRHEPACLPAGPKCIFGLPF